MPSARVSPAREGQAPGHRFTTRVGGTKGGSSEPSRTSRGRGIYGGPMVVEFLVLFMGRCTADDRLEICLFQDGLHLVDSLESNSALRGLPSLGGGRKDTSISSKYPPGIPRIPGC